MTGRLTIDGEAVIEVDETTGDITVSLAKLNLGPDADFAIEYSTDGGGRLYFQNSTALFYIQDDRMELLPGFYIDMNGQRLDDVQEIEFQPVDVRTLSVTASSSGLTAYHDGSGANTEGPAHYTSNDEWVSTVDDTTIS